MGPEVGAGPESWGGARGEMQGRPDGLWRGGPARLQKTPSEAPQARAALGPLCPNHPRPSPWAGEGLKPQSPVCAWCSGTRTQVPLRAPHAVDLDTLRTQWELWPGDSDLKAASGNSRRPWGLHAPPCPVSFKHLFSPLSFSILLDEEGHIKITGL